MQPSSLSVRNAREHNLKGFDLDLPHNALTVITGVSGSGKSSLAFDTIYQEGQRRFLESLSAYARQFLGQMERPRVDKVEGITPTLSIDQKTVNRNPRSTVGTITEIYDHFRLLYARLGQPHCPHCDRLIARASPSDLADRLIQDYGGQRLILMAPVVQDRKGEYRKELAEWLAAGWLRARIDGVMRALEEPITLERYEKHTLELVIDRLVPGPSERPRLVEAIERAIKLSKGLVSTLVGDDYALHAIERSCPEHRISIPELEPRFFSFNAPQGACQSCGGLGLQQTPDSSQNHPEFFTCPSCQGRRLNAVALAVRFGDYAIDQLSALSVETARRFFDGLSLSGNELKIAETLIKEIQDRLRFLDEVGLGYLHLDRRANSLSGGEAQRIRLAACVGSRLQGVTYVLDEPSIGLHPRDNNRLIDALFSLRNIGNTVLVVEHDRETMERADHVVDIGPGAGRLGGQLMGVGSPGPFSQLDTATARYLRDAVVIPMPAALRPLTGKQLVVHQASTHNLKDLTVSFPLGTLTVLTGVSGSGKSSLLFDVLEHRLLQCMASKLKDPAAIRARFLLSGTEHIDKLIEIDQAPIGRTPRSNPATYSGAFDLIRDLFAALPESQARGYAKGRFSFNVAGGRCESCEGAGVRTIEMQFLADVEVPCEACEGKRFNSETLDIRWKQKNISEVLEMTIGEAAEFFAAQPKLSRILSAMVQVGLDYVQLGQSATTLSGGEAQRLKLASELQRPATGHTLYLLDEPSTGLHFSDVDRLIHAIQALVNAGNTVIVIEHNTDLIKVADYLIELGPEGGQYGGQVVASGTPAQLAHTDTATGRVLSMMPEFGGHRPVFAADRGEIHYGDGGGDLVVEGARCHNLQGVTVRIPRGKTTVITGVSGSGKTSLAFDTIFAEGQRRYVEALSTYARRFLGRMERPVVDRITGLAPAIAIDQKNAAHNPRSTVATVTEIQDHLRLLWANLGIPHCPHCDTMIRPMPPGLAAEFLVQQNPGKGRLLAKVPKDTLAADLRRQGFARAFVRNKEVELEGLETVTEVVIDRFDPVNTERSRMAEAVALAYRHGKTRFLPVGGEAIPLALAPECPTHGRIHKEPLTPRHFSFNNWLGACSHCNGLGREPWTPDVCPKCHGSRLKPELLAVKIASKGIHQIGQMTVLEASDFFATLHFSESDAAVADQPVREIRTRLGFLSNVGLGYLTLDRSGDTLSGGESQRIRLASQLGSGLTGCIYVLDEPTVGLHPRDTQQLLKTLDGLKNLGNTLVIVEHDPETMRQADHIIDMGPEAGDRGGRVVAAGPPEHLGAGSVTGPWLRGDRRISVPNRRRPPGPAIQVRGATAHSLQGLDVDLPTGVLLGVTGVSGSGKSTLIMELLVGALKAEERQVAVQLPEGEWDLQVVDQSPIGRSPRSAPATYIGVLDPIRALFAQVPLAVERGYTVGRFSFNGSDGGCRHCGGHGMIQVEMHFLSNVWVVCEKCKGRRFNRETLDIRWKGASIADVLEMRVDEAMELFAAHRKIVRPLQSLIDVGLGYLRLGQPATELSGGEAQRIKLACGLMVRAGKKKGLFVLDEPTTGLHLSDVERLVSVLDRLVDAGHSVIVVEHHLDVIRHCDWLVDLGPEAGVQGGKLVAQGSPEAVMRVPQSWTGRALASTNPHHTLGR